MKHYDTVEQLTPETSRDKVGRLLRAVGVDPASVPAYDVNFPPPTETAHEALEREKATTRGKSHFTHASDELSKWFADPADTQELVAHYLKSQICDWRAEHPGYAG